MPSNRGPLRGVARLVTRPAVAVAAGMMVLLAGPPAHSASAGEVLLVDDDQLQCPTAAYTSVQSAVLAAQPGDTVQVCEGRYQETVRVTTNGVRIMGEGPGGVDLDGQGIRRQGFVLDGVHDVTVEGFTVRNHVEGIVLVDTRDSTVRQNVVTAAVDGIVARGSSRNRIESNTSSANTPPSGRGIHLTAGADGNIIRHNVTEGNGFGIQLTSAGPGNVVVQNLSTGNAFAGISNVSTETTTISHNTTSHNERNGIVVVRPHGSYAPLSATIEHNRSSANGVAGIALVHGGGNTVSHNRVWSNDQDGIVAHESFDNVIERNRSTGNLLDGIGIKDHPGNPLSTGNVVARNLLSDNVEHDCHDDSIGSGTAGTGNTWTGNHAGTENRPGLCGGTR